jgi:hypothetical protein
MDNGARRMAKSNKEDSNNNVLVGVFYARVFGELPTVIL